MTPAAKTLLRVSVCLTHQPAKKQRHLLFHFILWPRSFIRHGRAGMAVGVWAIAALMHCTGLFHILCAYGVHVYRTDTGSSVYRWCWPQQQICCWLL